MSTFLPPSIIKRGFDIICGFKVQFDESSYSGMGFFVSDRIIMTSASPLHGKSHTMITEAKITVRKLNEETSFMAEVFRIYYPEDTAFFVVLGDYTSPSKGTLRQYGTLFYHEKIFTFANAPGVSESFLDGYVSLSCDDVQQDFGSGKCKDYVYEICDEKLSRTVGCFWNKSSLKRCTSENEKEFKGNLRHGLPVIECRGFKFGTNREGCPIMNKNGEIVGMFIGGPSFPIALHVSVLRPLLNDALEQFEDEQDAVFF